MSFNKLDNVFEGLTADVFLCDPYVYFMARGFSRTVCMCGASVVTATLRKPESVEGLVTFPGSLVTRSETQLGSDRTCSRDED